jgi:hypothetical protein
VSAQPSTPRSDTGTVGRRDGHRTAVASNDSRAHNWQSIREWDGSQHRAFEELCFQLRTAASNGMTRRPTAVLRMDTRSSASTASTISSLRRRRAPRQSVRTSRTGRSSGLLPHPLRPLRPHPFTPRGKARTGARERWNSNVARWKKDLPGLADVDIRYVGGGELLERLTRPGNEGRQWFFFRTAGAGQRLVQGTGHAC